MVDITITVKINDVSIEISGSKTAWLAIILITQINAYVWAQLVVIY